MSTPVQEFNAERLRAAAKALKGLTGIDVLGSLSAEELDYAERRMPLDPYYQKRADKVAGLTVEQEMILRLCNEVEKLHEILCKHFTHTDQRVVKRVHNVMLGAVHTVDQALDMAVFK